MEKIDYIRSVMTWDASDMEIINIALHDLARDVKAVEEYLK